MKRQSSCEGSHKSPRKLSLQKSDSEVSNDVDEVEHTSRPSNLSSYAEYTESEGDDEELLPLDDVTREENGEVKSLLGIFIKFFKYFLNRSR